jgi:hypothetical protein
MFGVRNTVETVLRGQSARRQQRGSRQVVYGNAFASSSCSVSAVTADERNSHALATSGKNVVKHTGTAGVQQTACTYRSNGAADAVALAALVLGGYLSNAAPAGSNTTSSSSSSSQSA